jgi:hypothetical protein
MTFPGNPIVRFVFRWGFRLGAAVIIVGLVAFVVVFRSALYNRFVHFPNEEKAWAALRAARQEVPPLPGWQEYRGVLHSHSHFSHDSEVEFPEILAAAKEAAIDFIFLTDHCVDGRADFSWQWRGLYDGILFAPGFEMRHGFMPWGLPSDVVLDCKQDPEELARQIIEAGGVLFFAHSEEDRMWDLPELTGMEIYNIHTDVKDEGSISALFPDMLLSLRRYPDQVLRTIFDRQDAILANWDALNVDRRIVGIAASDSHQNQGFRGYYTEDGNFLLRATSPNDIKAVELNWLTRWMLARAFGPLEPGKKLFRIDLDPYERSLRYVNTHILARGLDEASLIESLRQGRVFIAFNMIADASGFSFTAHNGAQTAVLGDTLPLTPATELRAQSPLPCRFTLVRDGARVAEGEGTTFAYQPAVPGNYRLEADVKIRGTWTPWVYTNFIKIDALH